MWCYLLSFFTVIVALFCVNTLPLANEFNGKVDKKYCETRSDGEYFYTDDGHRKCTITNCPPKRLGPFKKDRCHMCCYKPSVKSNSTNVERKIAIGFGVGFAILLVILSVLMVIYRKELKVIIFSKACKRIAQEEDAEHVPLDGGVDNFQRESTSSQTNHNQETSGRNGNGVERVSKVENDSNGEDITVSVATPPTAFKVN